MADTAETDSSAAPARAGPLRPFLIAGAVLALLLALYAAAGYLLAPRLIADQARAYARNTLKQDLALGEVRVNPFCFTSTSTISPSPPPTRW